MDFPTLFDDFESEDDSKTDKKPATLTSSEKVVVDQRGNEAGNHLPPDESPAAFDRKIAAQLLKKNAITSVAALERELDEIAHRPVPVLGKQLVSEGFISEEDLDRAIGAQLDGKRKKLGDILLEMGAISQDVMDIVLLNRIGIPFIRLDKFSIHKEDLDLIPQMMARKFSIIPCCIHRGKLVLAMANPTDESALLEARHKSDKKIIPVFAEKDDIDQAIEYQYIKKQQLNPWQFKV